MDLTKTSAIMTFGVERLAQDVAGIDMLIGLDM